MSGFVDLLEIVKKALEEAERDFSKINVLIAGPLLSHRVPNQGGLESLCLIE